MLPEASRRAAGRGAVRAARRPSQYSELLTLSEAGKRFGLSERRVYRWANEGLVHPVKPQGRILYPEWELRRLAEGGARESQNGAASEVAEVRTD